MNELIGCGLPALFRVMIALRRVYGRDLARKLRVSPGQFSNYMHDNVDLPPQHVVTLQQALGVSDELISLATRNATMWTDEPPNGPAWMAYRGDKPHAGVQVVYVQEWVVEVSRRVLILGRTLRTPLRDLVEQGAVFLPLKVPPHPDTPPC